VLSSEGYGDQVERGGRIWGGGCALGDGQGPAAALWHPQQVRVRALQTQSWHNQLTVTESTHLVTQKVDPL
jgi:hypothetical protein